MPGKTAQVKPDRTRAERLTLDDIKASTEPLVTVVEAASVLGIGRHAVTQSMDDGTMPSLTVGRRRFAPRAAFIDWLEARTEQAGR